MYSRVLVPIDGGEQASAGLKLACLVAEPYKSRVILLCVVTKTNPRRPCRR